MRHPGFRPSALGPAALFALALLACAPPVPSASQARGDGPLRVAVTVPPQAYLVERLGGERVETTVLMRSGTSEETFSPSPRQMVALSRADLYVLVGHPAFLVERTHVIPALEREPQVRVVDMSAGMATAEADEEAHSAHDHAGGADDPHVWTAPRLMRIAARTVADALADLDPAGAEVYRERLTAFLAEVDALDAEIRRELSGLPRHRFLVTHPAWGHFAAEYGLEQVAIDQEGKEPSPAHLVALVEAARAEGLRVVFTQAGFPDTAARAIAREIGGRVVPLDPLARNWLDNTRATAHALGAALRSGGEEFTRP